MKDFTFSLSTKLIFGPNQETRVGEEIKQHGGTRVLVIYGQKSAEASGLLTRVMNAIQTAGLFVISLGGVEPNPKISKVREAISVIKSQQIDFLIALGGGSVIDTTKAAALGAVYRGDPYDFFLRRAIPKKAMPMGAIPTMAAAGSEMSTSAVISDPLTYRKRGVNSEWNRPRFAILNPQLTYSVSAKQTAIGVVDILMHTLERYFNPSSEHSLADEFALGLLRNVLEAGPIAIHDPYDYQARASLLLASAFSHNGITGIGKQTPMPVHQLEHALSGLYDFVPHGEGLSVLFCRWAVLYYKSELPKFVRFAREVMMVEGKDDEDTALQGIIAIQAFFTHIGMPLTFPGLGIEKPDYVQLLDLLFEGRETIPSAGSVLDRERAEKIYRLCEKEEFLL